ncbi:MAG: hypothetical protein M1832_005487 [Thelocarpon impressellum]|nr:MAG: hypothetical protein M1832_005487 [Thelocarpon impressellum]
MAKLLDFVLGGTRDINFDVEVIGDTAVFVRKEKNASEVINEFRGFGKNFPDEYTQWDSETKGSTSHHRIAQYEFAGLTYVLRFESDGYLPEIVQRGSKASPVRYEDPADLADSLARLKPNTDVSIRDSAKKGRNDLVIRTGGRAVDQAAMIEIKTRAAYKRLDLESVLPRLWISQTQNLVSAYHKGGKFDEVQVLDMRQEIDSWEQRNAGQLRRLNAVIRSIIDKVRNSISMKMNVKRSASGRLRVSELDLEHPGVLPDELRKRMRGD